MPSALALLLIVGVGLALGGLVTAVFAPTPAARQATTPLEWALASLAMGLAIAGWLALVLAEGGILHLGWWLLALGLAALGLAWAGWRRGGERPSRSRLRLARPGLEGWFLLAWLVAAGWLFFRPHQYVHGGADAGVYVNLAASIAHSGGILIDDPLLQELDPVLYPVLLRPLPPADNAPYYLLPGFYVTGAPPGQITPQFYPLHPVWQAVGFLLGGLPAALRMTGLWALLGGLAIYLTTRRIAGPLAAALALAGLTLNALQLWFARYPTTEMLTQFLLWTGLWALARWLDDAEPAGFWALLAGVTLGQTFLVRIDTIFLLAIPAGVFLWRYASRRLRRGDNWFFVPFSLLAAHAVIHAAGQSAPYFLNTFGYGLAISQRFWWLPLTAVFAFTAILLLLGRARPADQGRPAPGASRWLRGLAVGLLLLLAAYGGLVRPQLVELSGYVNWYDGRFIPRLDAQNVPRLNWYLSPLGFILAVAGTARLLWRLNRRTAVTLAVGLLFALLYLWRIQANPTQIYSMRRYVPAVMPFFMLAAATWLAWLTRRPIPWQRWTAVILAVAWLAGLGWLARGIVSRVDYAALPEQVAALAGRFEPDAIILLADAAPVGQADFVGTPLRFWQGRSIFAVRETAVVQTDPLVAQQLRQALSDWQSERRSIYWMVAQGGPEWPLIDWPLTPVGDYEIVTGALEGPDDRRPTAVNQITWRGTIYRLAPVPRPME